MFYYSDDKKFYTNCLIIWNAVLALTLLFGMPYSNAVMWAALSPALCAIILLVRTMHRCDRNHIDVDHIDQLTLDRHTIKRVIR